MLRLVKVILLMAPAVSGRAVQDHSDETSLLQVHKAMSSREKRSEEKPSQENAPPAVVTINGQPWGTAHVKIEKPQDLAAEQKDAAPTKATLQHLYDLAGVKKEDESATAKKTASTEPEEKNHQTASVPQIQIVIQQPSQPLAPKPHDSDKLPGGDGVKATEVYFDGGGVPNDESNDPQGPPKALSWRHQHGSWYDQHVQRDPHFQQHQHQRPAGYQQHQRRHMAAWYPRYNYGGVPCFADMPCGVFPGYSGQGLPYGAAPYGMGYGYGYHNFGHGTAYESRNPYDVLNPYSGSPYPYEWTR